MQKLRGIYDAIDNGNYKSAVKLCTALLQKTPQHSLCKALKALALERCDRCEEALQLCAEVRGAPDCDDTAMHTLQTVYRRAGQHAEILRTYEAALEREPNNEDLAVVAFLAATRCGELPRQQQLAMKLYTKWKKPKYLHWVVVSILLQVQQGAPKKVLDLAQMMLQKAPVNTEPPKDGAKSAFDRGQLALVHLHLATLRAQEKTSEALALLESCQGCVGLPADGIEMRIRLLEDAGDVKGALQAARALLLEDPAKWCSAQIYIQHAFGCPAPSVADQGGRVRPGEGGIVSLASMEAVEKLSTDDEVWNAYLLFKHLQEKADAGDRGRVPRLSQLEIRRLLFVESCTKLPDDGTGWQGAVAKADVDDFVAAVEDYLALYGHKNNCYSDLKPFLSIFDRAHTDDLLAKLESKGDATFLTAARLRRTLGWRRGKAQDITADISRLLATWATSSGAARDELLCLAVAELADLDLLQRRDLPGGADINARARILDAIALAVVGFKAAPECFQLKVLLVLLHSSLGLPGDTLKCYEELGIKNIQHESMSFLVMDTLASHGCHDSLQEISSRIVGFHEDFDKDAVDALGLAFRSGTYQRIPEYMEILKKLNCSVLWGRAVVEEVLCEVGQLQTYESLGEYIGRQASKLAAVAARSVDSWVLSNQDRGFLQGLHPLPLCSPAQAGALRRGTANMPAPTLTTATTLRRTVNSSCISWDSSHAARALPDAARREDLSAIEELITRSVEHSPARLKITAALLSAAGILLQQSGPPPATFAEALAAADDALGALGGGEGPTDAKAVLIAAGAPPGSCAWPTVCWRCAREVCEVGRLAGRCMSAEETWERLEERLRVVSAVLGGIAAAIRGGGASGGAAGEASGEGAAAGAFVPGGRGAPLLWAFLHGPAAVVVAVVLWCCTNLPKGGKKGKEGQEALQASRQALRALLVQLQADFSELHGTLSTHEKAAAPFAPPPRTGDEIVGLASVPGFDSVRTGLSTAVADSHGKHLQALREALGMRLTLLKTKSSFKA